MSLSSQIKTCLFLRIRKIIRIHSKPMQVVTVTTFKKRNRNNYFVETSVRFTAGHSGHGSRALDFLGPPNIAGGFSIII